MTHAPMTAAELLPDVEAETKPQCISGLRRKVSENTNFFAQAVEQSINLLEDMIRHVARLPSTRVTDNLIMDLHRCRDENVTCRDEFDSWYTRTPTPGHRSQTIVSCLELQQATRYVLARATSTLSGSR